MKTFKPLKTLVAAAAAALVLAACTAAPVKPDGAVAARARLTQLQADPQLASRAPVAIKDADAAVRAAEVPRSDRDMVEGQHLVAMATSKVDLAWAQAQARLAEDQRKTLNEQREAARLDARTREANAAHADANLARGQAATARADAEQSRSQAEAARMDTAAAHAETDAAHSATGVARMQADDLQRQIEALNAKATDRGLVVTLGDLLFETGRSDLKGSAAANLGKLATFLTKYPDRTVVIEGHTDNVGSERSNLDLSQRRADSVKAYLVGQGVIASRLSASGKGEGSPVAANDSYTGRQQNRRVEVIIANTVTSSR